MASIVTCIAPVNIAVIKYWGKRDEKLILPLNDSLSATLSTEQMHAKTTVMISPNFTKDRIWLNGKEESFENPRLVACLREIRKRATSKNGKNCELKVHICSENNFPTAAGLASSAAGYACLVYTLGKAFGVEGDLTSIARQGSGSACRSLMGGFVRWMKGTQNDGSDSIAEQVFHENHWADMRVLILVVSDSRKKVSSTSGMQLSVKTSDLLKHRVQNVVPQRTKEMIQALESKCFHTFAELTMRDSSSFHAVCLDTYPPAVYMNDVSHSIVDFVHRYNKLKGSNKVAYTFDAGPNACLFLLEEDVPEVVGLIKAVFPPHVEGKTFMRGLPVENAVIQQDMDLLLPSGPHEAGMIKYVIHTKVGSGPKTLDGKNCHLLNDEGLPKNLIS
ncbi:hypothetical protein GE061_004330 [Apolygus lucorum]|uniref:Diphosphomevalonate decarboxylase n=1 Tax=Apolygus lucorum TaxID=248454 RepID=A0A6A4J1A7_APOLU|nr:hypothetical protein GE061_004330 [Apolygus lucorum]